MTTYAAQKFQCSVCGAVSEFKVLASTNSFGSPDLDLRPAPMQRWTMDTWIQECPECGYVSGKISDHTDISPEFLKSEAYRSCDGLDFKSELAVLFYRKYMICMKEGAGDSAFEPVLHAAWCCDDKNDTENALHCRKLSIPLLAERIKWKKEYFDVRIRYETSDPCPDPRIIDKLTQAGREEIDPLLLMKADLLRRAGCFEQLLTEYQNVRFSEPLLNRILAFEIEKANQKDTNRYTVRDVPGDDQQ